MLFRSVLSDTRLRAEIVRWVAESLRPFSIVEDRGFKSLMKTGRPEYYLPSPDTVSWDVKLVFTQTRKRIAKMLQVSYDRVVFYKCKLKCTRNTPERSTSQQTPGHRRTTIHMWPFVSI